MRTVILISVLLEEINVYKCYTKRKFEKNSASNASKSSIFGIFWVSTLLSINSGQNKQDKTGYFSEKLLRKMKSLKGWKDMIKTF